ncbi:13250_t:CDS:2 [Ambispora gerdemannii]|uniref:13250_t:CDS:1 n=1 Tax=Ambispora gerdemannii TaxID=144530 RepID=A0A9N9CAU2_9GLOM|nr:13250_t:CDS:2 [Ambispora gerdemannii]
MRDTIRNYEKLGYLEDDNHIIFDYGQLLKRVKGVKGDRKLGNTPIIAGFHPPKCDSLWKSLEEGDYEQWRLSLKAINFKWKVELWFWKSGILESLNTHDLSKLCTQHLFPILSGPDPSKKMEIIDITSNSII